MAKKPEPKKSPVKLNPLYGTSAVIKGVGDSYRKATTKKGK